MREILLWFNMKNRKLRKILGEMRVALNPSTVESISKGWKSDPGIKKGEKFEQVNWNWDIILSFLGWGKMIWVGLQ